MKRLATLAAPLLALAMAAPAQALTLPAVEISAAPAVGAAVTLSTDADCVRARCTWAAWAPNRGGALVVVAQLGEGGAVVWIPAASLALRPYVVVVVKVTQPGGTNNFVVGQRTFVVTP